MSVFLGAPEAWAFFSEPGRVTSTSSEAAVTVCPSLPPDEGGAKYRYALGRTWAAALPLLAWCMLNPSTATHLVLDPTLRACEVFSRAWGYGGMVIVNMYAWRATDPKNLPRHGRRIAPLAIGAHNDEQLGLWTGGADVVLGWGKHGDPVRARSLFDRVFMRTRGARRIDCLGTNNDGSPQHPLYIARSTERRPWSPPP